MSGGGDAGAPSLGVALIWHQHPFEDLLALVRRAEALGYRAAFVDGDVSVLDSRGDADVLDGWTLTTSLLARTERIEIGSIRLVHHWNAAKLAQAVATAERMTPGRLRFLASIGGHAADARFGLPWLPVAERIAWLDETLGALRALWAGETVSTAGRYVRLDSARVRPLPLRPGGPPGRIPIEVAGRRRPLLEVVAAHADRWDVNAPPVGRLVREATAALEDACRRRGRDPASIARSLWAFTRVGPGPDDPSVRAAFRRWNPWFADVADAELDEAILAGPAGHCRDRIAALRATLGIAMPVLDLAGLDRPAAERTLESLAGA